MTEFETGYICPFCNAPIKGEAMNGMYGCDTGCEYVTVEIECPTCRKVVWSNGEFGSYEDDKEFEEYKTEWLNDFALALEKIKQELKQ